MNFIRKITITVSISIFAVSGFLHSQTEGEKVGEVSQLDKKSGEVIVGSPTAGSDIAMGDLLYLIIDGKIVQLRATFPMQTIARCKAEGKNRALWTKTEKGMPVYRFKKGVESSEAVTPDRVNTFISRGPGGGWIFYDKGNSKGGWRYLEAAPEDQSVKAEWSNGDYIDTGASGTAIGDGLSNTQKIIRTQGEGQYAARICALYRGGGKSDWFLPSKDELNLMYEKLKINGHGNFTEYYYWSSSQYNKTDAWSSYFSDGYQNYFVKGDFRRVRAIRAY